MYEFNWNPSEWLEAEEFVCECGTTLYLSKLEATNKLLTITFQAHCCQNQEGR